MHPIPKVVYRSAAELDDLIKLREADAADLPPGEARQSVLKEIARLRIYADAKRWIGTPSSKARASSKQDSATDRA